MSTRRADLARCWGFRILLPHNYIFPEYFPIKCLRCTLGTRVSRMTKSQRNLTHFTKLELRKARRKPGHLCGHLSDFGFSDFSFDERRAWDISTRQARSRRARFVFSGIRRPRCSPARSSVLHLGGGHRTRFQVQSTGVKCSVQDRNTAFLSTHTSVSTCFVSYMKECVPRAKYINVAQSIQKSGPGQYSISE